MRAITLSILAAAGMAAAANAEVVLSFGFTDLNGSYNSTAGQFTANADNNGLIRTGGDVTRLQSPGAGTATYATGFFGTAPAGLMNFQLNLSVFNKANAGFGIQTADGSGSFTITDKDGSTITGTISGTWIGGIGSPGSTQFNGLLSNVLVSSLDGTFDGLPGSFDGIFGQQPLEGALVNLLIQPAAGFFDADFTGVTTQTSGEITPAPGAIALLGLVGLIAGRRRR